MGDGKHVTYLQDEERWRHLDPELFDVLKRLVDADDRSVRLVQPEGVLADAAFAPELLDVRRVPVRDRTQWRRDWFERVRNRLSDCDLVFADPDNGLFPDDRFRPTRSGSAKRIPLAEVKALAEDRAAIIYHHNTRRAGGHGEEIRFWMNQIAGCTHAYYWRRWSNRTFFRVNPDEEMQRRITSFSKRWGSSGRLLSSTR